MALYKRKGSKYWWFTLKPPGQKQIVESTGETDERLARQIFYMKCGQYQKVPKRFNNKIKLFELIEDYLMNHAITNNKNYIDKLSKFRLIKNYFSDIQVSEITRRDIEDFLNHRVAETSKSTSNRYLALIKHLFNKEIERGLCVENPAKGIKKYSEKECRRTRYLNTDEKIRLLNACPNTVKNIVLVALNTGMRRQEIMNWMWDDIDFNKNIIEVSHSKSGKPRSINMNSELINLVKSIPRTTDQIYVFGIGTQKPGWDHYRKTYEKSVKKAQLKNFRFHDMRRTFGTDLLLKGVDIKTICELLGHASILTTEIYLNPSSQYKQDAVDLLPGLLSEIKSESNEKGQGVMDPQPNGLLNEPYYSRTTVDNG